MLSLSSNFTKDINVFYDSLFHLGKINKEDILTIYKLDFDYSLESLEQKNIPLKINFGNSNSTRPFDATRSCYVDAILINDEKAVLIVSLKWIKSNLSQNIDGYTHTGDVYQPVIYKYDINSHNIKQIYPTTTDDEQNWAKFVQGDLISTQTPLASFDIKTNKLSLIYKVKRSINTSTIRCYIDTDFKYNKDSCELTNTRILEAIDNNGAYSSSMIFQRFINHNNTKFLIGAGIRLGKKKILAFKLKDSTNSNNTNEIYLLTENGYELLTEDGENIIY